jgi:5'-methylthioadenosine phosphorylase
VIGMTNLPEAKLAREAEIAYATLALVTDYDCWHPEHDHVTVDLIIDNLNRNAINAQKIIQETVKQLSKNLPLSEAHLGFKICNFNTIRSTPARTTPTITVNP